MFMSVLVNAKDVPAASRLEYWQHTVDEILGPLEVRMPSRGVDLQDHLRIVGGSAYRSLHRACPFLHGPCWE
jgi:hypothetical protein